MTMTKCSLCKKKTERVVWVSNWRGNSCQSFHCCEACRESRARNGGVCRSCKHYTDGEPTGHCDLYPARRVQFSDSCGQFEVRG